MSDVLWLDSDGDAFLERISKCDAVFFRGHHICQLSGVWGSCLGTLPEANSGHFLSNSAFSDIMLVVWNQPWWGYLRTTATAILSQIKLICSYVYEQIYLLVTWFIRSPMRRCPDTGDLNMTAWGRWCLSGFSTLELLLSSFAVNEG